MYTPSQYLACRQEREVSLAVFEYHPSLRHMQMNERPVVQKGRRTNSDWPPDSTAWTSLRKLSNTESITVLVNHFYAEKRNADLFIYIHISAFLPYSISNENAWRHCQAMLTERKGIPLPSFSAIRVQTRKNGDVFNSDCIICPWTSTSCHSPSWFVKMQWRLSVVNLFVVMATSTAIMRTPSYGQINNQIAHK